jgi:S-adenosylmethionine/arginine decarboxylase-like enzyme
MHGLHLTADLYGCAADEALLTDAGRLGAWCRTLVAETGLVAVADRWHRFPLQGGPETGAAGRGGVTGVVLLAESHLAVHTWPERAAVTLDVYVCNLGQDNSARAEALMARAIAGFRPSRIVEHRIQRGTGPEGSTPEGQAAPPAD